MAFTTLKIDEQGVVCRRGHRRRFAAAGEAALKALDNFLRDAKPGVWSLTWLEEEQRIVSRWRERSLLKEGIPLRFCVSPYASELGRAEPWRSAESSTPEHSTPSARTAGFSTPNFSASDSSTPHSSTPAPQPSTALHPKPAAPSLYDSLREPGVSTLLTSPDGAQLWESCSAALVGWDGELVFASEEVPRVDSVAEWTLKQHLPWRSETLWRESTMPLALINAVAGLVPVNWPQRAPFPHEVVGEIARVFGVESG